MQAQIPNEPNQIYRVDKFIVPNHVRNEFMDKVLKTHEFLRMLPGFLEDVVLEQVGGAGEFNFVTIVKWANAESIENAKSLAMAKHKEMEFNPQEMFTRLNIKADLANYKQLGFDI
jgi:heme-degrading monooxygenase HmoA